VKDRALPEVVEKLFLTFCELHQKYPQLSDVELVDVLTKEVIPKIYWLARKRNPWTIRAYQELCNALFTFATVEESALQRVAQKSSQESTQEPREQEGS